MLDKLKNIISEFNDLGEQLSDPAVMNDIKTYQRISQEYSNLKDKATLAQKYIDVSNK